MHEKLGPPIKCKSESFANRLNFEFVTLKEILHTYQGDGINRVEAVDELKAADQEGRYWRHHSVQKKLENIEKSLANIALEEAREQEKLQKEKKQTDNDIEKENE